MQIYINQSSSYTNKFMSVSCGLALTLAVFSIMEKIVSVEFLEPAENYVAVNGDIFYAYEPIETQKNIEPPKKTPVEHAPEPPKPVTNEYDGNDVTLGNDFIYEPQDITTAINFGGTPVPQYLVAAKYPSSALRKGIEGYVDLRFDISKIGTTKNIRVIAAVPEGYFEKAAVAAVERWRYQPATDGDEAKPFLNMTKRVRFQMQK